MPSKKNTSKKSTKIKAVKRAPSKKAAKLEQPANNNTTTDNSNNITSTVNVSEISTGVYTIDSNISNVEIKNSATVSQDINIPSASIPSTDKEQASNATETACDKSYINNPIDTTSKECCSSNKECSCGYNKEEQEQYNKLSEESNKKANDNLFIIVFSVLAIALLGLLLVI